MPDNSQSLLDQLKDDSVLGNVDDIIDQLRSNPADEPDETAVPVEMTEEELGKFILGHGGQLIRDSTALVSRLKKDVGASGDPEGVSALADLIAATSTAIESLNKIYTQNKKIKAAKEIKQIENESKKELIKLKAGSEGPISGLLVANREEIIGLLMQGKRKADIIDIEESDLSDPDIDADHETRESSQLTPA